MANDVILVVEDDPDHRELLLTALSDRCARERIATASGCEEALAYLFGQAAIARGQPRLVVIDVALGPHNGIEVLKAIREHESTRTVPVIMLSGTADKSQIDACYRAGANGVVRKETDFEALRRKLHHTYDFWMKVNQADRMSRI